MTKMEKQPRFEELTFNVRAAPHSCDRGSKKKKVYKCESEDVKVLEMGRSRPCSSASSLLSSVGVCGRFVLPQQRQQRQQSPHGRQAVVQPPFSTTPQQQSSDDETYGKTLPLTEAGCINHGVMTNKDGLCAPVLEQQTNSSEKLRNLT